MFHQAVSLEKTRSYMIAYHVLDKQQPEAMNSYGLIEKIRKCYIQSNKCHRSIDDFERKCVNDLLISEVNYYCMCRLLCMK